MTSMPLSIEPNQSLAEAKKKMHEVHARHLPVRSAGKVVGLLSDRDIGLLASFAQLDLNTMKVSDAMMLDPYCVHPDVPVDTVCAEMAEKRYGSALVVQENDRLVGIFTYTDALRALSEVFGTRLKK